MFMEALGTEVMEHDDDDNEAKSKKAPKHEPNMNLEAKLNELLHRINSIEIKLCSDATKEFIKLLKGSSGEKLLNTYVRSSSNCSELLDAWKLHRGKAGMACVMSLVSAFLSHPCGKQNMNGMERVSIWRVLDKFARLIVEEHLQDVHKELNSQEVKHRTVALSLMASIVRRGSGLASEVAKNFDFKLRVFSKHTEHKSKQRVNHSMRKSVVGFAISFLEVGKPGLLRWVLQQRDMYSGVLRGLGNDDEETIIYVLSTLKDRVLVDESLVSPGLRSVLFGSVTLEQLARICERDAGGSAEKLAYDVLVMVCTDPRNGLMPDLQRRPNPFIGNPKRIVGLMRKLKATEFAHHRDLLIAIVKGRPSLCAAYLEEFPYNLEDYTSPSWFAVVSLAANLLSSVSIGLSFGFLDSQSHDLPTIDDVDVRSVMKCLSARPFSRSVFNKGLLHANSLAKHGILRLLLEVLMLLDTLIGSLHKVSCSSEQIKVRWSSLKHELDNEIRMLLPDPQVLLSLLSSFGCQSKSQIPNVKRKACLEYSVANDQNNAKKLKMSSMHTDADIFVSRISGADTASLESCERMMDISVANELDDQNYFTDTIVEIWAFDLSATPMESETLFQCKLLDTLKIYLRIVPKVFDGSFEFLNLSRDSLSLPTTLQSSLLSLLSEYIGCSSINSFPVRTPPGMYRYLHPIINLLIFSPITGVKEQAYFLAQSAIFSTGAFDQNTYEIGAWFLFLPGYNQDMSSSDGGVETLYSISQAVISFLCDGMSTVGNNLFKYWGVAKRCIDHLSDDVKDVSIKFSPVIICVLQKCLRLLNTESGNFTLPEKSMISLYVSNTLKYILQSQADAGLLASVIESLMRVYEHQFVTDTSDNFFCEWRPLKILFRFCQRLSDQRPFCIYSIDNNKMSPDSSFTNALDVVKGLTATVNDEEIVGVTKSFIFSMICTPTGDVLKNFPSVMNMSKALRVSFSLLSSLFFSEENLLSAVSKIWPNMFFPGLEMVSSGEGLSGIQSLNSKELINGGISDAGESSVTGFSFFLKQVPFHVLFSAIMSINDSYILESPKIRELLLLQLSETRINRILISYLHLVLFWVRQLQILSRNNPLDDLQQRCQICFMMVKSLLTKLLVAGTDPYSSRDCEISPSTNVSLEIAEIIFGHSAVIGSLSCPLMCHFDAVNRDNEVCYSGKLLDSLTKLFGQKVHKYDCCLLDIVARNSVPVLSSLNGKESTYKVRNSVNKRQAFDVLTQKLIEEFRNSFELYIKSKDMMPLFPAFFALRAIICFISPFSVLELADWMFTKANLDEFTVQRSSEPFGLSLGFCIAAAAFKNLPNFVQQTTSKRFQFLDVEEMNSAQIIEKIYLKICKFVMHHESEFADLCLLEAVEAVYKQKSLTCYSCDKISLEMSTLIIATPVEVIMHCVFKTSKTKARLLFILTELSSLHLSIFGHVILGNLNECPCHGGRVKENTTCPLSNKEWIMLVPATLLYLNSISVKFGKQCGDHHFRSVVNIYSRVLFGSFLHWDTFVSEDLFEEEYGNSLPSSSSELLVLFKDSLLRKSIDMLRYCFGFNEDSNETEKRLKLLNSIFLCEGAHNTVLDFHVSITGTYSSNQLVNLMNKVVAKISLGRMLLFPEDTKVVPEEVDEDLEKVSPTRISIEVEESRVRFLDIMVNTWQLLVENFPLHDNPGKQTTDSSSLFRYLEIYILENITELVIKMRDFFIQSKSIPFLKKMMKVCLRNRFGDLSSLKTIRGIITSLAEGNFSRESYLKLLLGHSQFARTIQSISKPSIPVGAFLRPMSSILRSLVIPSTDLGAVTCKKSQEVDQKHINQLEIVKLLRVLVHGFHSGKDSAINFKELQSTLLCSYGATCSEIDLVLYNLTFEMESIDGSNNEIIAGLEFLWGNAASKIKNERDMELSVSSNTSTDPELVKERRRNLFRENLHVDPKICASTVLYFPHEKITSEEPFISNNLQSSNTDIFEAKFLGVEKVERYDPFFILRFAIRSLLMGYLEPGELASLGLLAIAFVSLSSINDDLRKLGYETLGKFKDATEKCQKRKDIMKLRLLLSYVQNGIEEPWQRIPSIIALFAAELSFILLDPSNDHHAPLCKILTHSSGLSMKSIPLFHNFLWSSSVNFKAERLWILRLVYAGMNVDGDAQIYTRNSIPEALLSFYISPLSDNVTKELILQFVKKSVKLHKMARYLVEQCGLLPWLSTIFSSCVQGFSGEEKSFFLKHLTVVLEVVNEVITSRNIVEWLQNCALEQLMELSSRLFKFLLSDVNSVKEQVVLVARIFQTIISTLKISQKRKIYLPHFTLSICGLFCIYQVVNTMEIKKYSLISELGLKTILMSTPPITLQDLDKEKFSSFIFWTIAAALESDSAQVHPLRKPHCLSNIAQDEQHDESFVEKLLRWLTASVILQKISSKSNFSAPKCSDRSNLKTLQSLMECVENTCDDHSQLEVGYEEFIAAIIFYLQQLLDIDRKCLPSVISALCLLLHEPLRTEGSGVRTQVGLLWSKIHCPVEANPAWRWSYHQPWKDHSLKQTQVEKMDQLHACQTLLVILSNVLRKKPLDLQDSLLDYVEDNSIFEWERSVVSNSGNSDFAPVL